MTRQPKDLGASVQAKLRNLAQQRGDDVQLLLTQFVLERLLHRLAASEHAGTFLLKGAMLFAAWTKVPHRATRDLDLLGQGDAELPRLVTNAINLVVDKSGSFLMSDRSRRCS